MLDKPQFDCTKIGDFYDCGCADDDEVEEKGAKTTGEKSHAEQATTKAKTTGHDKDVDWDAMNAVAISKEP